MKNEVNPYQRSEWANTFAFHDFDVSHVNLSALFDYVEKLFSEYGLVPTRMGITKSLDDRGGMKAYRQERKKLVNLNPVDIIGVDLQATSFASDNSHGSELFALHISFNEKFGYCILVFDEQFFTFVPEKVQSICQNIIQFLSPAYAYMFHREFKKGPVWYPMGVISGIMSLKSFPNYSPEAEFITMWNHKIDPNHSQAYKTGDLRDIYPIQMVMDVHLERVVLKNMTLRQFIESSPNHGRLESLDNDHYLWWVDEKNISDVREKLRPSGLMIAV